MGIRTLWILFYVFGMAFLLHLFRYEPFPAVTTTPNTHLIWDRWGQKVCLVAEVNAMPIICDVKDLEMQSKVNELKAAGFSEKEIGDWLHKK